MRTEISIPTIEAISMELNPILTLLTEIKAKVELQPQQQHYYRNKDLKTKFGLSDNTIISYREKNILPYTQIGEIFYYPVIEINNMLSKNSNYHRVKSNLAA